MTTASSGENAEEQKEEDIQQEIVSAVEEAAKEGVVDEQEREMIESVIEFRDTTVGQIMTSRPEIMGLEISAKLPEVKAALEESMAGKPVANAETKAYGCSIKYAH